MIRSKQDCFIKHIVATVVRTSFLYCKAGMYIDTPSPLAIATFLQRFLLHFQVQEFFSRLNEAGLSFLTKRNYHKCVKRFLGWVTTGTDIFNTDRPLYMLLRHLEDCVAKWSRELLAKRVNRHRKTVEECQVILRVGFIAPYFSM